jgi:hypothetical protein
MAEKDSQNKNFDAAFGKVFRIIVFIEASKSIYLSRQQGSLEVKNP